MSVHFESVELKTISLISHSYSESQDPVSCIPVISDLLYPGTGTVLVAETEMCNCADQYGKIVVDATSALPTAARGCTRYCGSI